MHLVFLPFLLPYISLCLFALLLPQSSGNADLKHQHRLVSKLKPCFASQRRGSFARTWQLQGSCQARLEEQLRSCWRWPLPPGFPKNMGTGHSWSSVCPIPLKFMEDDYLSHLCCVTDNKQNLCLQSGDALSFRGHCSHAEIFILTNISKVHGNAWFLALVPSVLRRFHLDKLSARYDWGIINQRKLAVSAKQGFLSIVSCFVF